MRRELSHDTDVYEFIFITPAEACPMCNWSTTEIQILSICLIKQANVKAYEKIRV
jgi:glutaredoxin-related protein